MDDVRLSSEQVRHIAQLARLDVADAEVDELRDRLSAVLEHVARLNGIDVTDVAEMPHVADERSVMSDDTPGPMLDRQTLLDMAPQAFDRFVRVPKVLGEGGGA
ncbi:MAG: Asp-tRNA(Asn)/Glu-tRNA(Gln) amidotransferase subunit GatC [Phycisphaerales bacterium]